VPLKDLKPGVAVQLNKLVSDQHRTTPPSRWSEVSLIRELMDVRGIARPSTASSIVSLIQERGYVAKKGTQLYPTPLGFAVARLLAAKFPTFTAYEYTAKMEEELDEIAGGAQTRVKFLDGFWHGKDGFEKLLEVLSQTIDFKELEQYSTIDLHNGYSVKFSKFGTFLQDNAGTPNEKGYLPSARLAEDVDLWEYKDADVCKTAMEQAASQVEARELGVLASGEYSGWTVWARDGRLGPYVQALSPEHGKAGEAGKKAPASAPKPINYPLAEPLEVATVTLEAVESLFAEVKLPRWSPDSKWLVGVGKKGPYMGRKATVKSRPVFRSLPPEYDVKTIEFSEVQKLWAAAEEEMQAKAAAKAAKPPARKAPAKKAAPRRAPAKKPAVKPAAKSAAKK
jgi:DNA topoisomerase-1